MHLTGTVTSHYARRPSESKPFECDVYEPIIRLTLRAPQTDCAVRISQDGYLYSYTCGETYTDDGTVCLKGWVGEQMEICFDETDALGVDIRLGCESWTLVIYFTMPGMMTCYSLTPGTRANESTLSIQYSWIWPNAEGTDKRVYGLHAGIHPLLGAGVDPNLVVLETARELHHLVDQHGVDLKTVWRIFKEVFRERTEHPPSPEE